LFVVFGCHCICRGKCHCICHGLSHWISHGISHWDIPYHGITITKYRNCNCGISVNWFICGNCYMSQVIATVEYRLSVTGVGIVDQTQQTHSGRYCLRRCIFTRTCNFPKSMLDIRRSPNPGKNSRRPPKLKKSLYT
jgi:hypothetical protein